MSTDLDYLIPPERLESPEFTIRCYEPGDGPLINEAVNSSYEHLRTFLDFARPDTPMERSEQLVRKWRGDWLQGREFFLGIFSPEGNRQLGSTGYMRRDGWEGYHQAEIGLWIRASAAGRGLGTRVLRALLEWGFTEWPWLRLEWRCDTRNVASARVAEKAGMQREACLRRNAVDHFGERYDTYIYAMLRHEWPARIDRQ